MLEIKIKSYKELDIHNLYEILRLRSQVFVVEQNCVYQDLDGKDQIALHVLGYKKDILVAYTRIFDKGLYFKEASIGRVVVEQANRKYGFGHVIMKASIEAVKHHFKTSNIKISAQTYLRKFYNNLGFIEEGNEYLEDDIPHIAMRYQEDK